MESGVRESGVRESEARESGVPESGARELSDVSVWGVVKRRLSKVLGLADIVS